MVVVSFQKAVFFLFCISTSPTSSMNNNDDEKRRLLSPDQEALTIF